MIFRPALVFCLAALASGCGSCDGSSSPKTGPVAAREADTIEATAEFELEPSDRGTFELRWGTATIARARYRFFGAKFQWVAQDVSVGVRAADGSLPFEIELGAIETHIKGTARRTAERVFEVEFVIENRGEVSGIEGGGVEFELHPLDSLVARGAEKTELLDDPAGFRWSLGKSDALDVTFIGQDTRVFFERGKPEQVRAFFVGKELQPRTRTVTMRVELPASGTIVKSLGERYAAPDPEQWHRDVLAWDTSPVDLSFLNDEDRPAGKLGRIEVRGDKLTRADGTEVRLWGANVTAGALTAASHADIAAQAKRLAALGFNLVRLHHHDSGWVKPNVFGTASGSTRSLDESVLANLDWWVKCLRDEGIYVWLDIHVGRAFTESDGVTAYSELRRNKGSGKALNYVNPSLEERMSEFASAYLNRRNRFTDVNYTNEPAVLTVLVTNENDLAFHGVRPLVPGSGNSEHIGMLHSRAAPFMKKARIPGSALSNLRRPGPAKIVLTELEARFGQRSIAALTALGYDGPVATTSYWGKTPLYVVPALTVGSIVDAHTYGAAEFLRSDPRHEPHFVSWIAGVQVAGMPMTVSEWNVPLARDRFVAPLFFASVAALQEWDAAAFYAYSQHPFPPPQRRDQWSSLRDAGSIAMMPAAALMFRQGHVSPAKTTYRLDLARADLYGADTSARTSRTLRTLTERSRVELGLPDIPELDWDTPRAGRDGATIATSLGESYLEPGESSVVSDTGELRRDWATGVHTIDTDRSDAAQGWIGGRKIELEGTTFSIETAKASVAVTSLDGLPLATSRRMLVTAVGQVESPPGEVRPLLSEPVHGVLELRNVAKRLELVPLAGGHDPVGQPTISSADAGVHRIELPSGEPTHWFELRPASN